MASAFLTATLIGDHDGVIALLAPDAVLISDGGRHRHAARRPVVGPDRIARFVTNLVKRLPAEVSVHPATVNGSPGVVGRIDGRAWLVQSIDVVDGLIVRIHYMVNPDKLVAADHVSDMR